MCTGKDAANQAFVAAYFNHLEDKDTFVEPLPDDDEMSVDGSVAEDEDEDDYCPRELLIQPDARPFDIFQEVRSTPKAINFAELYGKRGRPLQVIVKLANIHLVRRSRLYSICLGFSN